MVTAVTTSKLFEFKPSKEGEEAEAYRVVRHDHEIRRPVVDVIKPLFSSMSVMKTPGALLPL